MTFDTCAFFVFLAIVLGLYAFLSHQAQNVMLLIASYIFYGWWNWKFVFLIMASTAIDFYVGVALANSTDQRFRKKTILLSLVVNLGILGFFKYYNFFVDNLIGVMKPLGIALNPFILNITLPVGISFFTFHGMSYTIDVYRGTLKATRNFVDFALFVSFFPQLVAGPIGRATNQLPQVQHVRRLTWANWERGSWLVLTGLFKKVVVADTLSLYVDHAFQNPEVLGCWALMFGVTCFAFQIYLDFAGYSEIARGVAFIFGFELITNFAQPYFAHNITDFWRRWHISLSTWLRDYLYIPLGGNRYGSWNTYRNLFLTMLLGGLWHGASWNFVIWGGLHGIYLALHKLLSGGATSRSGSHASIAPSLHRRILGTAATFVLVCVAWVFFRAQTLEGALQVLERIITLQGALDTTLFPLPGREKVLVSAGLVGLVFLLTDIPCYRSGHDLAPLKWPPWLRGLAVAVMAVLLISTERFAVAPFIYFQF